MNLKTATEILGYLEGRNIKLWIEDGKLKYSAPKGIITKEIIDILKKNKENILHELNTRQAKISMVHDESKRYDKFQLSSLQGAYIIGRSKAVEYGGLSCNVYMELEYDYLEREKTQEIWNRIISENDMLHTIVNIDGWQQVLEHWDEFVVKEYILGEGIEKDNELKQIKKSMGNKTFDTLKFPLFQVALSQMKDSTIMHFSIDMLIVDWTSIWKMIRIFEQYYFENKYKEPLKYTFKDYMDAYQNIVETKEYKKGKEYWQNKIPDLPQAPIIPIEKPTDEFYRYELRLSSNQWIKFKEFALSKSITPVAALVSAYSLAIERFSSNKRYVLNLTTLNRIPFNEEVKEIIGDFTSLSLLTMDHLGRKTFAEIAEQTNVELFQVLDNHLYSGMEVAREKTILNGGQHYNMPYVFTSSIGLIDSSESNKMVGKYRGGISQTPQVFIDCQVMDGPWGLIANWDVRKGIFPEGIVERMFDIFSKLVTKLAEDENKWDENSTVYINEDSILSDENNYTTLPEHLIHSKILESAQRYPDKLAIIDADCKWSYKDLMLKASAIALKLKELKLRPGSKIGIVLEKSCWQVAAVLAVLSENCVYVPIDAGNATNRRDKIIKNASIGVVITSNEITISDSDLKLIKVDQIDDFSKNILKADGDLDDDAYIIYTSGSTGEPKGVVITHRAAVNTIEAINDIYMINKEDTMLGLSQLNFDLSVYDIFGVLSVGGTLVLPSKIEYLNPAYWAELIEKYNITLWNSVPAFAQMLCTYLNTDKEIVWDKFKVVMLSGDWIPLELPDNLLEHLPNVKIACMGGATEASIWSNLHEYKGLKKEWKSIPYGRALPNQEMYVLDSNLNICPVGIPGEIYIGGIGLGRCYFNDENLTSKAFIISDGKRLYKTGDRGRYSGDNEIEFLGRCDKQVKIRGHRIELGEIENAFYKLKGVKQAAAIVTKYNGLSKLFIFILNTMELDKEEMKKEVSAEIPGYMIPDEIEFVKEFPLSSNGKLSRDQLNDMALSLLLNKQNTDINSNRLSDTEKKIEEIVKSTLKIEHIDPTANLYEYGTDSLTMAQIAGSVSSLVKDEKAFDYILLNLFNNPNIRAVAEAIDKINSQE